MANQLLLAAFDLQQLVAVERKCRTAGCNVSRHRFIGGIQTEPDKLAVIAFRLIHQSMVLGVEYQPSRFAHRMADYPLDSEQLVEIAGAKVTEMILTDIRNQGGIRTLHAQAPP